MSESRLTPTLARPGDGRPASAASSLSEHEAFARTPLLAAVYHDAGAADGVTVRTSRSRPHASRRIACSRS
jgi:hypothetical protein